MGSVEQIGPASDLSPVSRRGKVETYAAKTPRFECKVVVSNSWYNWKVWRTDTIKDELSGRSKSLEKAVDHINLHIRRSMKKNAGWVKTDPSLPCWKPKKAAVPASRKCKHKNRKGQKRRSLRSLAGRLKRNLKRKLRGSKT